MDGVATLLIVLVVTSGSEKPVLVTKALIVVGSVTSKGAVYGVPLEEEGSDPSVV
jgi:hypothetical protein